MRRLKKAMSFVIATAMIVTMLPVMGGKTDTTVKADGSNVLMYNDFETNPRIYTSSSTNTGVEISKEEAHSGSKSLKITRKGDNPWNAYASIYSMYGDKPDLSGYNYMVMYVKATTDSSDNSWTQVMNEDSSTRYNSNEYTSPSFVKNEWTKVSIPIGDNGVDLGKVSYIKTATWDTNGGIMYVDDIYFTNSIDEEPTTVQHPSNHKLFNDMEDTNAFLDVVSNSSGSIASYDNTEFNTGLNSAKLTTYQGNWPFDSNAIKIGVKNTENKDYTGYKYLIFNVKNTTSDSNGEFRLYNSSGNQIMDKWYGKDEGYWAVTNQWSRVVIDLSGIDLSDVAYFAGGFWNEGDKWFDDIYFAMTPDDDIFSEPQEETTVAETTEEVTTEAPTEEVTTEAPTEEITTEAPTEEITTEAPTEEVTTVPVDPQATFNNLEDTNSYVGPYTNEGSQAGFSTEYSHDGNSSAKLTSMSSDWPFNKNAIKIGNMEGSKTDYTGYKYLIFYIYNVDGNDTNGEFRLFNSKDEMIFDAWNDNKEGKYPIQKQHWTRIVMDVSSVDLSDVAYFAGGLWNQGIRYIDDIFFSTTEDATVADTKYTVNIDGANVEQTKDDVVTLGDATYGYYNSSTKKMYPKGYKLVVKDNITVTSVNTVSVSFADGAGLRYLDSAGIRFQATVTSDNDAVLTDQNTVKEGMLITAKDLYDNFGPLTLTSTYTYKNIVNSGWYNESIGTYCGSIADIVESNYIRNFVARAYVTINYVDGESTTVYSDDMSVSRSVQGIAAAVKNAGYPGIPDESKTIIDTYAAAV